jgi:hypothetical protein
MSRTFSMKKSSDTQAGHGIVARDAAIDREPIVANSKKAA